jgi:hypothetical protein
MAIVTATDSMIRTYFIAVRVLCIASEPRIGGILPKRGQMLYYQSLHSRGSYTQPQQQEWSELVVRSSIGIHQSR